jgi:hypothetical protein
MQPSSLASPLSEQDLNALRRAKHQLESPALAMKLASIVGAPLEKRRKTFRTSSATSPNPTIRRCRGDAAKPAPPT